MDFARQAQPTPAQYSMKPYTFASEALGVHAEFLAPSTLSLARLQDGLLLYSDLLCYRPVRGQTILGPGLTC